MPRINAWIVNDAKIKYLAKKYGISDYLLASLNLSDAKAIEEVAKAHRLTIDREYYEGHMVARRRLVFFGRPVALRFREVKREDGTEAVRIIIRFKTAYVMWDVDREEYVRHEPEWWVEQFRSYILVKAEKVEYKNPRGRGKLTMWRANDVKFVNVKEDRDTFRRLVEAYARRYDFPVLAAMASILGYHPDIIHDGRAAILLTARILPAISPEPIHAVEFTVPGTGKTTTALIYELALDWRYFAEVPSLATLVGDARTGTVLVAKANGIWFDEFDAWIADANKRAQMRDLIEALHTGMWQGKWARSKGGVHAPETTKPIPLYHSGNVYGPEHPRNKLMTIIRSAVPDKALSYNDRIAIAVTAVAEDLPTVMQEMTLSRKSGRTVYGRPSVIRGAVELLAETIAMKARDPAEKPKGGRIYDNYIRVYRAIQVLYAKSLEPLEYEEKIATGLTKKLIEGIIIQ